MKIYREFFRDDTGAVTIDWVALTAGILLLGIMAVYAIFNQGVSGLVNGINSAVHTIYQVPRDDYSNWRYDLETWFHDTVDGSYQDGDRSEVGPGFISRYNRDNDYLIDRAKQKSGEVYSGVDARKGARTAIAVCEDAAYPGLAWSSTSKPWPIAGRRGAPRWLWRFTRLRFAGRDGETRGRLPTMTSGSPSPSTSPTASASVWSATGCILVPVASANVPAPSFR